MFPNPNSGTFTVNYELGENEKATITVTDLLGKAIVIRDLPIDANSLNFDLSRYGNGIYSVQLVTSNKTEKHWKTVVIK